VSQQRDVKTSGDSRQMNTKMTAEGIRNGLSSKKR
jgi:hypothetical protein